MRATNSIAGAAFALCFGLAHAKVAESDIVLVGFSDQNYARLNSALGKSVCVVGTLKIDTIGAYFPLQPIEKEGVIDVGFSRVLSGLTYDYAARNRMRSGKVYRICGILRDATPFKRCDSNYCRWYQLEHAELRRKS